MQARVINLGLLCFGANPLLIHRYKCCFSCKVFNYTPTNHENNNYEIYYEN